MTSSAFLSWTACTAPSTLRGSFAGAFRRVAIFLETLVFAMQVVYRSIQMMLLDMPRDANWNEVVDWQPAREPFANHRRRDIARVRVDEKNLRRPVETLSTCWRWRSARAQFR